MRRVRNLPAPGAASFTTRTRVGVTPSLTRIGAHGSPVVVIDSFDGDVAAVIEAAAGLAPFGRAQGSHYPGLRRPLTKADGAAWAYAERTLRNVAPFIGGGFGAASFDLLEASFSIVTDPPDALAPPAVTTDQVRVILQQAERRRVRLTELKLF